MWTLQRLALLAPDRVPRALLGRGVDTHALGELSMVTTPERGFLSTHRLVWMVARDGMSAVCRQRAAEALLVALAECTGGFSTNDCSSWHVVKSVRAHAESLLFGWMPDASGNADVAKL